MNARTAVLEGGSALPRIVERRVPEQRVPERWGWWKPVLGLLASGPLIFGLIGCGTSAKRELRVQALAEAHQIAPARLHGALSEADQAVLDDLRARLATEIYPLWNAEREIHDWFSDCLERLGAVGQSSAAEVDACKAEKSALGDALQTIRDAPPQLTETADSLTRLEAFLAAVAHYLDTEPGRKAGPKAHARYAEMVDAHNRWVEATEARRSEIIRTLPTLLDGLSSGATP